MSIIAIRWAYSRRIKNPVAKNVLVFLCTHDFPGNTSVFKVKTIAAAVSYQERIVRDALSELHQNGYIDKQERTGEKGQRLSNSYTILIHEEYVQEFCKAYELSTPPLHDVPVPPAPCAGPPLHDVPDIKYNAFKNNIKKRFCFAKDQKLNKMIKSLTIPVDNSKKQQIKNGQHNVQVPNYRNWTLERFAREEREEQKELENLQKQEVPNNVHDST